MSGGFVHLRGPDINGQWTDWVFKPGLPYELVIDDRADAHGVNRSIADLVIPKAPRSAYFNTMGH